MRLIHLADGVSPLAANGDGWRSRRHLVPATKQYLSRTQSEDWQDGWRAIHGDTCQHAMCRVETLHRFFSLLIVKFRPFEASRDQKVLSCVCSKNHQNLEL